jgi:hypothetical protein
MRRIRLSILLLLFLCSCRAERFNPLDPESPYFKDEATVYGYVSDWVGTAVEDASILLQPGPYVGTSSVNGEYEISGVRTGTYTLVATRDGFSADTQEAQLQPASPIRVDFELDQLPIFAELTATSHNDSSPTGNDLYAVFFARIYDSDGWVWGDSVFVELDSTLIWPMGQENVDSFSVLIPDDSLPGGTLEYLVGRRVCVLATDNAGKCSASDPFGIYRIIYECPVAISPDGVAPQNPVTFRWFTVKGDFDFTYTLTLEETWPNQNSWIIEGISPDTNEYFLGVLLEAGIYRWSVRAVDSFGNTSRSQILAFTVS